MRRSNSPEHELACALDGVPIRRSGTLSRRDVREQNERGQRAAEEASAAVPAAHIAMARWRMRAPNPRGGLASARAPLPGS